MEIESEESKPIFNLSFKVKCFILAALSILLYINSTKNEFALDDGIVIDKNEFVEQGFGGVTGILTHDAYYSYYHQMNAKQMLPGGRYRPLSVVIFAIEHGFFGKDSPFQNIMGKKWCDRHPMAIWHIIHFFNVLFYALCVILIFFFLHKYLLSNVMKGEDIAFLAAILFTIHPMHTEVVANAKSLDEIMSMIFIVLTFIFSMRYLEKEEKDRTIPGLLLAAGSYFLALLSKEYAITLLVLLPVLFYTVLKEEPKKIVLHTLPYIGVFALYVYIRFRWLGLPYNSTKAEVADPHLFIAHMNKVSGIIKIFALLPIFAVPALFYYFGKKNLIYAITNSLPYFVLTILYLGFPVKLPTEAYSIPNDEILNNPYMLASPVQKIGSEIYVLGKYLYMLFVPYPLSADYSYNQLKYRDFSDPMVWLVIVIYALIIVWTFRLLLKRRIIAFPVFFYLANLAMVSNFALDIGATMGERLVFHSSLGFVVLLSYGIVRSPAFKFKKQIIVGVLSIVVLLCGIECINRNAQWKKDATLFVHDVEVVPNSVMANGNAGARYLDLYDAVKDTSAAGRAEKDRLIHEGIYHLTKSIAMHPKYTTSYLNLGLAYFKLNNADSAKKYWDKAKQMYPDHPNLPLYYQLLGNMYFNKAMLMGKEHKLQEAVNALKYGLFADKNNINLWYNIGGAYYTMHKFDSARYAWMVTMQMNPKDSMAIQTRNGLASLPAKVNEVTGIK